jgi:hypothetical protein
MENIWAVECAMTLISKRHDRQRHYPPWSRSLPVAVIQQKGYDPLIVMGLEDWIALTKELHENSANTSGGVI